MAGQLVERAPRTWVVRVYLGRDASGKRKYVNRTVHGTKKDAQLVLNALLREKDLGGVVEVSRSSLDEHLAVWLKEVAQRRVRARTFQDYESIANRYIRPHLGAKPLPSLQPRDIQLFYGKLGDAGLSSRTVRHVHAVLNNALEQAVRWRMISQNPCSHVDLPKAQRKEMAALSPEHAERFLAAAKDGPYYSLFSLLLTSGLRPGEALALRWSDVDLKNGSVTVVRALAGKDGKYTFEEPKTSRSRRRVPIPASVVKALQELKHEASEGDSKLDLSLALVFPNQQGGPLELRNLVKRHFKPLLKKAGLSPDIRLYDLRHSCATLLLQAGINPKIVSERLGHVSITLTLDTYSHVLPDMQQSATEELEKMLFTSGT